MTSSAAAGDVFNARDLATPEVAERFLPPPVFDRLLSKAHCILEGPRGSGKTTLLRMLTPEAFSIWRQGEPGLDIEFIGVFVPADVRWAKQLSVRTDRISSEVAKDALLQAVFSVAVNLALVETIERSAALHASFGEKYPALFFKIDRSTETQLVMALAYVWHMSMPVASFSGIKLALRKRQHELSAAAAQLADGCSLLEVQRGLTYLGSTWLDNLVTAIESVNDVLGRPGQLWAILLDELEIVPEALLRTIVDALRSTSNKIRFKLALVPTGSDLIPSGESGSSSHFEDYRPVKLWYERKGDARAFASRLFAASLSRLLNKKVIVEDLHQLLGHSWSSSASERELDTLEEVPEVSNNSPSLQRLRAEAFSALYDRDESFRKILDDRKVDPNQPPYSDTTPNGILVRKITQLVLHREKELESFTIADGARRRGGRRSPSLYYGFPNLIDLTEGNPRWVLTLAESLIATSRTEGQPLSAQSVQSQAIRDFVQQMVAKLMVYPTRAAAIGKRWTPYDFVKALGQSIEASLFDGPFLTDPAMSFVVDQAAIDQFGEYIRTAIDLGALIIMRRGSPAPLSTAEVAQSLLGSRVRITYRLAPEFRIPLLYTKEQRLSSALRAGDLLNQPELEAQMGGRNTLLVEAERDLEPPQQGRLL